MEISGPVFYILGQKLVSEHVFNVRKIKRIARYNGLETRRCEVIKGIVAPEIGPESFGAFGQNRPRHVS